VRGGGEVIVDAPIERIPVWVRSGSIVVTYPAWQVASRLSDDGGRDEFQRPLVATPWRVPRLGRTAARLADGGASAGTTAAGNYPAVARSRFSSGRSESRRSMLAACISVS
jgi:hypothetical protein